MLILQNLLDAVAHRQSEAGHFQSARMLLNLSRQMSQSTGTLSNAHSQILAAINHKDELVADRACGMVSQILLTVGTRWYPESADDILEAIALQLSEDGFRFSDNDRRGAVRLPERGGMGNSRRRP